ncbi:MAG TPA: leucyl aminopeptidase [Candidatus Sulfotelmatobacter sp.]|jgi:leucyl aminopeptidase|nr:leucyl aminopeptidase [Candidatus Sulfotelmatobacter sp.]
MKISFAKPTLPTEGALVVGVLEGRALTPAAVKADQATGGQLARAIAASRFEGKKEQALLLQAPAGIEASRVLLLGLGKAADFDALAAEALGGAVIAQLASSGDAVVTVALDGLEGSTLSAPEAAAAIALGARLRSYRFDKYRTKEKKEDKPSLKKVVIALDAHAEAKKAFAVKDLVAEGVFLTRDLASEPANVIYPESLAEAAKSLSELGLEIEVLGEKQMKKLGMGALLGVGQGSARESQLVTLRWNGGTKDDAPVAFVGKGVCFDSGGISIKPAANMEDMKWDMGGAAVVIGLMKALALRKAKVNVVGVVGLVENMPSGTAQRPGDVVTSMSGQTIEVINTDAEGRLVLADALWYTQQQFKPHSIVDLATLTGAIIVSLGSHYAGLFSNDDDLADKLTAAGKDVGEKLWRMPVDDPYDKMIKSEIADMKNVGEGGAGSVTAAMFLKRFIKDTKWAHLDIAGVTWAKADKPVTPKGATAFGVRLLDRLVAANYEQK